MQEYVVNRPDEGAMDRILEKILITRRGSFCAWHGRRDCCGRSSRA